MGPPPASDLHITRIPDYGNIEHEHSSSFLLGRKFEVKILTPNSLEDEDSTSSMLSQEEVEAFQNMIVNLLVSDYRIFVATAKDIVFLELVITRDI